VPIAVSLGVIVATLLVTTIASLIGTRRREAAELKEAGAGTESGAESGEAELRSGR